MAIFTAIAGAFSAISTFIGGLGAIGSFLLKTAVSIGLNLLAQAVAGKPKDPAFAINGKIQGGGDAPRSFIIGRYATAGSLVWVNSWGKDNDTENAFLSYVIALSDLPVSKVDELWVNGEKVSLRMADYVQSAGDNNLLGLLALAQFNLDAGLNPDDAEPPADVVIPPGFPAELQGLLGQYVLPASTPEIASDLANRITLLGGIPIFGNTSTSDWGFAVPEYKKDNHDHLWVKFYDGTQTAADPFLVNTASNNTRQWDANRIGAGIAYAIITVRNKKNMFSGFPEFKFVVSGTKFYDPSKDSSVGGVGPQRYDTPTTWGGDGDLLPAVQAYNLLRGIKFAGQWFYGVQNMSGARLPVANWIVQIEKCRAPISSSGGTEPTYRCSGEIQIDAPLANALEAINTTCQGRIAEVGGVYSMFLGAPDAPEFSFTDDDILSTEEQSFTPFFGLADTINGISATYPSPQENWNVTTAPPIYRTDLEALAGNRRLMADVELNFVPYPEQVQRLMLSALLEGQRARRHTLSLPPAFWPYAVPGVICSFTSARNGYVSKLCRIDGSVDKGNLDVIIDITEVDPSDFDWDSGTQYQTPSDGVVGRIVPPPQAIVDWFAGPDIVTDNSGGARRPAIRLTWDNSEGRIQDVDGIEFEVRLASTLETVYGGRTDQPEASSLLISQGLLSLTDYGVRGRYIPSVDAHWDPLWSNWLPVTTYDIRLGPGDLYPIDLAQLQSDIYQTLQSFSQNAEDLRARLEQMAVAASDIATRVVETDTLRVESDRATARVFEGIDASIEQIGDDLAVQATRIDGVETTVSDLQTDVDGVQSQVNANSSAIDGLESTTVQQGLDIATNAAAIQTVESNLEATNTDVEAAQAAADAAATLAGSKGKVIVSTSEPAAGDRLPQNLWIDITGNANTPKRWNGSAWVAVSDKIATDAAAAVAALQTTVTANSTAITTLQTASTQHGTDIATNAAAITSIESDLSDQGAGIAANAAATTALTTQVGVIDGEVTALADSVDSVEASVAGATASGLFRMTAEVGTGDVTVRLVAQVRATVGDAWVEAGYFIEAGFVGGDPMQPFSRYVINVDQFVVTDGTDSGTPLVFQDGEMLLKVARIEELISGVIHDVNDKFVLTVQDGKIEWFD